MRSFGFFWNLWLKSLYACWYKLCNGIYQWIGLDEIFRMVYSMNNMNEICLHNLTFRKSKSWVNVLPPYVEKIDNFQKSIFFVKIYFLGKAWSKTSKNEVSDRSEYRLMRYPLPKLKNCLCDFAKKWKNPFLASISYPNT